jgi:hypothetical protein
MPSESPSPSLSRLFGSVPVSVAAGMGLGAVGQGVAVAVEPALAVGRLEARAEDRFGQQLGAAAAVAQRGELRLALAERGQRRFRRVLRHRRRHRSQRHAGQRQAGREEAERHRVVSRSGPGRTTTPGSMT